MLFSILFFINIIFSIFTQILYSILSNFYYHNFVYRFMKIHEISLYIS